MPALHKNRVKMTVASVAGSPYTITLDVASSAHQSFATAYGANATVDILITQGTAWEVARNCTYTHSGTTVTRGTFEASSTGSVITTFNNTATVEEIATAEWGNITDLATRGAIQGFGITYSSQTAIVVAAGTCAINGKLLSYAGGTLTSGGTPPNAWKDLNNATVTIAASKSYYVYAFDNAGTLEIRVQDYAAATYGGVPTFDTTYDYWKAPSVGAQARRIGVFWTDGSGNILRFVHGTAGRMRRFQLVNAQGLTLVNADTGALYTAVTVTPYATTDSFEIALGFQASRTSVGPAAVVFSLDSGTSFSGGYRPLVDTNNTGNSSYFLPLWSLWDGTLYYGATSPSTVSVWLCGIGMTI